MLAGGQITIYEVFVISRENHFSVGFYQTIAGAVAEMDRINERTNISGQQAYIKAVIVEK